MKRWTLALALAACKLPSDTESPDGGDDALERIESTGPSTPEEGAAGPTAATDKKALPKVRDRDPEEEKKKMALSRQRSAEARKMLTQNRLTEAIDHSRQALKIHEQNVDAMLVLAEVYYKQGKFELVHAVTSSALQVDAKVISPQETSRVYNLKGFAYVAMGDENLATQSFRKAADADEKNASAWNNLGTRYMAAGDVATAKSCFTYALELEPRFAKAHLNLGAALRAEGKWTDAEKSLNAALKLKPNWAEAFFNLGVLYLDADPYPGLDTVARLNKSIQFLTRYRELAVSDGPEGPGSDPTAGIARAGGKGTKIAPGPASVSKARAEDYIRVAKKGIEREERKAERERARGAKEGGANEGGAKEPAKAESGAKEGAKADGKTAGGSEAGQPDSPTPKTPATPSESGAKPESAKPSTPTPSKPQTPGQSPPAATPTKPQPSAPSAPSGPPPAAPKPQAPKPQAPTTTPAPTTPAPTPPAAPKPQAPKPQAPSQSPAPVKPQTPAPPKRAAVDRSTSATNVHACAYEAWNPRSRVDTHHAGAMLGSTRMSLATRTHAVREGTCT